MVAPSLCRGFPGRPGRGTPRVAPCFCSCSRVRVRLFTSARYLGRGSHTPRPHILAKSSKWWKSLPSLSRRNSTSRMSPLAAGGGGPYFRSFLVFSSCPTNRFNSVSLVVGVLVVIAAAYFAMNGCRTQSFGCACTNAIMIT